MTIPAELPRTGPFYKGYNPGDSEDFGFSYSDKEDVKVTVDGDFLIYGDDYSVVGQQVTFNRYIGASQEVIIYRVTPLDNDSEYPQEAPFDSQKINDALDKLTRQNQEQAEELARAIKIAMSAAESDKTTEITKVEGISPEADKCLKWNSDGTALQNSKYDPDLAYEEAIRLLNNATKEFNRALSEIETIKAEATTAASQAKIQSGLAEGSVRRAEEMLQTAANFSMPDLMARVDRQVQKDYQASVNGWLYLCTRVNDGDSYGSFSLEFSNDGKTWLAYPVKAAAPATGRDTEAICVPIPKGYWYRIPVKRTMRAYYFIPCVGSTIAPEHGSGFSDGYSRDEMDNLLSQKMDQVALAAPLSISVVKNTPDNISTLDDGTAYLNQDAFEATYPENLGANSDEEHMVDCNGSGATEMNIRCLAGTWSSGELPKVNLKGCNCFLRNFAYDDIIMAGETPGATNATNYRCTSFVLGTLSDDMSFMPRLHVDSQYYPGSVNAEGVQEYSISINIRYVKSIQSREYHRISSYYTGYVRLSYPNDTGSPAYGNPPIDSVYCNVIASSWTHNVTSLNPLRGIYLRKFYKTPGDLNPVLAIEPVFENSDGNFSFEEYVTTYTPLPVALEDLELNCVLYDSYAFRSYTLTSVAAGFDVNDYYLAHNTLSNKVATLGEVSESKYLQVKTNPDQFVKGDRGLELKPATTETLGGVIPDGTTVSIDAEGRISASGGPQLFSETEWNNLTEEEKASIKFAAVYKE